MQPAMFCFGLNFRISLGSRQSSTASSGQTSHRASNLWAAANLSGPGETPACNSSSTLPNFNGGHRQNSKPVADGGSGPPAGGLGQDPAGTLSMPTAASKMQGNSVSSLFQQALGQHQQHEHNGLKFLLNKNLFIFSR